MGFFSIYMGIYGGGPSDATAKPYWYWYAQKVIGVAENV